MKKLLIFIFAPILMFSCHNDLWDAINDHEVRINELEEMVATLNSNTASLHAIVTAIQGGTYIVSHQETAEGYIISLSNGQVIHLKHGTDGQNGIDGQDGTNGQNGQDAPIIGIKQFEGLYYWTITVNGQTTWLLDDDGNKIPVTGSNGQDGKDGENGKDGKDGENGKDGKDGENGSDGQDGNDGKDGTNGQNGITPTLSIDSEGYWIVNYGNGWEYVLDANGNKVSALGTTGATGQDGEDGKDGENGADGKDGTSFVITEDATNVYITQPNGDTITIPKQPATLDFDFQVVDAPDTLILRSSDSYVFQTIQTNVESIVSYKPTGWKVEWQGTQLKVTASDSFKSYNELDGVISIMAVCSDGRVIVRQIIVSVKKWEIGDVYLWKDCNIIVTGNEQPTDTLGIVYDVTPYYIGVVHIDGQVKKRFMYRTTSISLGVNSPDYGMDNKTSIIIENISRFPAWEYCISQPYGNWYLPAINELIKIYNAMDILNKFIRGEKLVYGGTYPEGIYWSSTTNNNYNGTWLDGTNSTVRYLPSTLNVPEFYVIPVMRIYF